MHEYLQQGWQEILEFNQLEDFAAIWQLQAGWFEEPNQRRGGWSGVSRVVLALPDGGESAVFVKRQENHLRKTWAHPIKGIPTFRAEMHNILKLQQLQIFTMEPVLYAERKAELGWQCILITRELTDYQALDKVIEDWHSRGWASCRSERRQLIHAAGVLCARLHKHRLVHMALHAKHLFVNLQSGEVCFIDLEKMRSSWSANKAMLRDLDSLNRHVYRLSRSDRLRFLLAYFAVEQVTAEVRQAWQGLVAKQRQKLAKAR